MQNLCIMTFYECLPIVFVSKSEEYQGDVWGVLVVSKGFWTVLVNGMYDTKFLVKFYI